MSKFGKNVHDESGKIKYSSGQKCTDEDTGLKKKEGILINNIKGTQGKTEKSLTKKKGKNIFFTILYICIGYLDRFSRTANKAWMCQLDNFHN